MSEGRRRRRHDAYAAYRRPSAEEAAPQPDWETQESTEGSQGPSWDQDTVWDDEPVAEQYDNDRYYVPEEKTRQIVSVDRAERLACALGALCGVTGLFVAFAEEESEAVRRFGVQSSALLAANLACGALAALITLTLGSIPIMGFVIRLMCLLGYVGAAVVLVVIRVRLLLFAWRGVRFRLPLADGWLESRFL